MNPEQAKVYENLPDDHEIVKKYNPRFIAIGGDHVVYEAVGHPDVVVKASRYTLKEILSANSERGLPLNSFPDDLRVSIQEKIARKNEQISVLRNYFGHEHTLSEKRFLGKVPLTPEIVDRMYADDWFARTPPNGSQELPEAWSSIVVQEKTEVLGNPERMGFYFGRFLEERGCDPVDYRKLNEAFVLNRFASSLDLEVFFRTQDNPATHALADLMERCKSDPNLREVVSDMVIKMMGYAEDTGNALDIGGTDNVILYKENEKWTYLLIDVIPFAAEHEFEEGKLALHERVNGRPVSKFQRGCIRNTLNFTRALNGMAQVLAIPKRLEILREEDKAMADPGKLHKLK
jgi:hypothetical protein